MSIASQSHRERLTSSCEFLILPLDARGSLHLCSPKKAGSRFFQPTRYAKDRYHYALQKTGTGSLTNASGDYFAGLIGANFTSIKPIYRQIATNDPLFPLLEKAMLALLAVAFVAIQSMGRSNE